MKVKTMIGMISAIPIYSCFILIIIIGSIALWIFAKISNIIGLTDAMAMLITATKGKASELRINKEFQRKYDEIKKKHQASNKG